MAGENTAHRPPSRLALLPPTKIKAPCHFSLGQGKYSSFFKIPYQSPKKCLKTQITTFSILKFSPKAKNTPVSTVFTLFLLFVFSSHCTYHHPIVLIIQLFSLFEDSTGQDISANHRVSAPVRHHHRVSAPAIQHFEDSTGYCQILRFHELPYPKSHKNDLF